MQLFGKGADFFGNFSLFAVHLQGQAEDHAADFLFRQDLADFGQIFFPAAALDDFMRRGNGQQQVGDGDAETFGAVVETDERPVGFKG